MDLIKIRINDTNNKIIFLNCILEPQQTIVAHYLTFTTKPVLQDKCPYSAMPFADTSCLAHVALSRYKTKANKKLPWMQASREFVFALFCIARSSRRLSL